MIEVKIGPKGQTGKSTMGFHAREKVMGSGWALSVGAAAESELGKVSGPVLLKVCFGTQVRCLGVKRG